MIHALPDKAPSIADTVNEVGDTDAVDNMPKLTSDLPTVAGAETEPQQELTNGISDAPAAEEEELETPKTLAKLVSENTLTPPLLSKHRLKLVFVGDGTVGKTSLLNYYQMRQTIQDDKYTVIKFD